MLRTRAPQNKPRTAGCRRAVAQVIILHHTDCGMLTFDNPTIHGIIKDKLGHDASGTDFLPFSDLEKSVRDDVAIVQGSKLVLPGTKVTGAIYDVKTGAVSLVE